MSALLPGSTIGILGGGQLGRMLILAGRYLGYRFVIYDPSPNAAAGPIADKQFTADYLDFDSLKAFAEAVDVVTLEFEGIPVEAVQFLEKHVAVRPSAHVLGICQNRRQEKTFLKQNNIPCAPFTVINSAEELKTALEGLKTQAVLKTAQWGYDGKGQIKINDPQVDAEAIWQQLDSPDGVLEEWITFKMECSVVVARCPNGAVSAFPVAENKHEHHILDISLVPARLPENVMAEAQSLAIQLAEKLEVEGLLAVEFFVTEDDKLIVNEMAPRPHNSGHYSMDACTISQFEQCVRAICDLPLSTPKLISPVAMVNLLGNVWKDEASPPWETILQDSNLKLHLYDKGEARIGRKMGHVNLLAESNEEALKQAEDFKAML